MKNPPCQDAFVELITPLPLDLNCGLVGKSRRCLVRVRLGSFLARMPCRFRVKTKNAQCKAEVVESRKFPWATCYFLCGPSNILHKEARELGQFTVLNVLLD